MQLFMKPTSPYARVARVVLHEKKIAHAVDCIDVDPWDSPASLVVANPHARVPALVTDSGHVITEGLLIALYLERLIPDPPLIPAASFEKTFYKAGLGQGLMDAGTQIALAKRFRNVGKEDHVIERRYAALERSFPQIEQSLGAAGEAVDLGDLIIVVALEYLDLRLDTVDWRADAPRLSVWHQGLKTRPSLLETRPA